MYNYSQVLKGIAKYVDDEILTKINGWQKWIIGAGVGVSLEKSTNLFNELKNNSMVKTLGIIDKNDKIDVELLYRELKKQAQKGAITFELQMIGVITLNERDVDIIYSDIVSQI